MSEVTPGSRHGNAGIFFIALVALGVLRIVLGFASFPTASLPIINSCLAAVYLGVPILALFFAAQGQWTAKTAIVYLLTGVALQVGFWCLDRFVFHGVGVGSGISVAISQIGLPTWCAGLGALVALLIRDKNLLVPLAIFLGFFDAFMVLSSYGLPNQVLTAAPQVLESIAGQVPAASHQAATGRADPGLLIGPADFVFIAMFFVVLFRFSMRTRQTLFLMIPVLVGYLLLVVGLGKALPALIPIGAVVLLANWPLFKLSRDEILATVLATVLGAGLFIWGMTVPPPKTIILPPKPQPHAPQPKQPRPSPGSWA